MWALLLKLWGCKQGKKKPCNLAEGVVRFRVNNNIKKELQVRIRKKKKERKGKVEQSVTYAGREINFFFW